MRKRPGGPEVRPCATQTAISVHSLFNGNSFLIHTQLTHKHTQSCCVTVPREEALNMEIRVVFFFCFSYPRIVSQTQLLHLTWPADNTLRGTRYMQPSVAAKEPFRKPELIVFNQHNQASEFFDTT